MAEARPPPPDAVHSFTRARANCLCTPPQADDNLGQTVFFSSLGLFFVLAQGSVGALFLSCAQRLSLPLLSYIRARALMRAGGDPKAGDGPDPFDSQVPSLSRPQGARALRWGTGGPPRRRGARTLTAKCPLPPPFHCWPHRL